MDTAVQLYLKKLVAAARAVLGDNLVGAYAAGSLCLDAYEPGRSDIDVALVCERAVDTEQKRQLVSRLRHETLRCPARGLELVLYQRGVARSGTPDPGYELELNTGSAMPFRATFDPADRPAADGRFWYALDRSILHQSGLALFGPPAAEVFGDLGAADLRTALIDALNWWLLLPTPDSDEPAPGAEDAVLGACRSLVKHRDGVWLAKVAAGRHLLSVGQPEPLIEQSIEARHGGPSPSGRQARAFQQLVRDEIGGSIEQRSDPKTPPPPDLSVPAAVGEQLKFSSPC
jgi:hypothetical protein